MRNTTPPLPDKQYDIIYADPPWDYGMPMRDDRKGRNRKIELPYEKMSFDELSKLPIGEITEDDCLLFMWVVSPFLPECIKVGESWGFTYK